MPVLVVGAWPCWIPKSKLAFGLLTCSVMSDIRFRFNLHLRFPSPIATTPLALTVLRVVNEARREALHRSIELPGPRLRSVHNSSYWSSLHMALIKSNRRIALSRGKFSGQSSSLGVHSGVWRKRSGCSTRHLLVATCIPNHRGQNHWRKLQPNSIRRSFSRTKDAKVALRSRGVHE